MIVLTVKGVILLAFLLSTLIIVGVICGIWHSAALKLKRQEALLNHILTKLGVG